MKFDSLAAFNCLYTTPFSKRMYHHIHGVNYNFPLIDCKANCIFSILGPRISERILFFPFLFSHLRDYGWCGMEWWDGDLIFSEKLEQKGHFLLRMAPRIWFFFGDHEIGETRFWNALGTAFDKASCNLTKEAWLFDFNSLLFVGLVTCPFLFSFLRLYPILV